MNTADIRFTSNKVRDIERQFLAELSDLYPEGEVRMFVRLLFEAFLGWDQAALLARRDETVNQSDLLRFHWALEDLKRYRPIQHITGYVDFCGCRIAVDESTLIPRPETEEMVERIIEQFGDKHPKRILDLCTGSGCIAIALAKRWPEAEVTAVDISEKAIAVAKRNAETNNVKVNFIQADVLRSPLSVSRSPFSLIVSNPPYVMEKERAEMQPNVLDWEPSAALFVPDDDPLLFYRAIAEIALHQLAPQGNLVVEINEHIGKKTLQLFLEEGFAGVIENDFRGRERALLLTMAR